VPIAIVTGADSGIGRAIAVTLAERRYDLGITWYGDAEGAAGTVREIEAQGRRARHEEADFEDVTQGAAAVARLADELGGIDVLVNNAGTGATTPFLEISLEEWQRVLNVDLTAAFTAGQEASRRMVRAGRGGRIVNITSVHEHVPLPLAAAYCAAKGGLGLLTKVMAFELAEHAITVNAVAPGEIATPMTGQHDEDPLQIKRPGIPLGRPGHAREVAAAVAFLASPEAGYITGDSFVVDGGLLLSAAVRNQERKG
jgi:NAD(P)-dependent dehydrogenase (short-subunit alcohol dehydrogenase family)